MAKANKFSLVITATVTSRSPLGKPRIVPDKCPDTGKQIMKKITSFDQESEVEVEFPQWPAPAAYIVKALENIRGQVAKVAMEQLERAKKKMELQVLVEPVVYEKLDKHYMKQEVDKRHGFAFEYPIEYKEHELTPFFVKYAVPYLANPLDSELMIHKGFDLIMPAIRQDLIKQGVAQ